MRPSGAHNTPSICFVRADCVAGECTAARLISKASGGTGGRAERAGLHCNRRRGQPQLAGLRRARRHRGADSARCWALRRQLRLRLPPGGRHARGARASANVHDRTCYLVQGARKLARVSAAALRSFARLCSAKHGAQHRASSTLPGLHIICKCLASLAYSIVCMRPCS
jgi:hypothetical protein